MIIHNPARNYKQAQPVGSKASNVSVRFKGEDEPPKIPEFLKPFQNKSDEYIKKNKMSPLKTTFLVLGTLSFIVGLTVATHLFMPVVFAALATFGGVLVAVMALFNQVDKPVKLPPGVNPMTPEQMVEDIKYQRKLNKYNRSQMIKRVKNFFRIK